jgi:hypothetical protein
MSNKVSSREPWKERKAEEFVVNNDDIPKSYRKRSALHAAHALSLHLGAAARRAGKGGEYPAMKCLPKRAKQFKKSLFFLAPPQLFGYVMKPCAAFRELAKKTTEFEARYV